MFTIYADYKGKFYYVLGYADERWAAQLLQVLRPFYPGADFVVRSEAQGPSLKWRATGRLTSRDFCRAYAAEQNGALLDLRPGEWMREGVTDVRS